MGTNRLAWKSRCSLLYRISCTPTRSLDRRLNDVGNPAQQKALVLAPRSCCENHTQQFALRVGPGNRPGSAAVAEGSIRGQITEGVPRRRPLQPPAQTPGMTEVLVLVHNHGLNRGPTHNALAVVNAAVEEHLQEGAQVIDV